MKTSQFYYPLPQRLIAQHPSERRGTEKMMVLRRDGGIVEHRHIADFTDYITSNDILVVNDTKVFPARLVGEWPDTHGQVEVLLVSPSTAEGIPDIQTLDNPNALVWNCIVGSGRKVREGQVAVFGPRGELRVEMEKQLAGIGAWRCRFVSERPLMQLLDEFGRTPVPPYVHREGTEQEEREDRERYQTIYARHVGSVAAPTAGLHFTPEIFAALEAKGVKRYAVTLHVGPGTFRPVKAENIEDHQMDYEAFTLPPETAAAINECKRRGGRVFCCGSTTVRTLETVACAAAEADPANVKPETFNLQPGSGASNIFIYPPYEFKVCDCMLTNFHLPQSTLLMMISALAGRERVLCAYSLAVRAEYRFFSYGDCMLIV